MPPDPTRLERLHKLVERYPGDWTADVDGDTLAGSKPARFALLMNRANARGVNDWWITTHTTLPDALQSAGEDVLFGNTAVGVFDLDTATSTACTSRSPSSATSAGTDAPAAPWDTEPLAPAAPLRDYGRLAALLHAVETTLWNIGAPGPDGMLSPNGRLTDWLAGKRRDGWEACPRAGPLGRWGRRTMQVDHTNV